MSGSEIQETKENPGPKRRPRAIAGPEAGELDSAFGPEYTMSLCIQVGSRHSETHVSNGY